MSRKAKVETNYPTQVVQMPIVKEVSPATGNMVLVELPGEITRCEVMEIIDDETIVVKVVNQPMVRTHEFQKDDIGVAFYRKDESLRPKWFCPRPYREEPTLEELRRKGKKK